MAADIDACRCLHLSGHCVDECSGAATALIELWRGATDVQVCMPCGLHLTASTQGSELVQIDV